MSRPASQRWNSYSSSPGGYTGNGIPKRAKSFDERRAMIAARAPIVRRNRALFDAHYEWLTSKRGG